MTGVAPLIDIWSGVKPSWCVEQSPIQFSVELVCRGDAQLCRCCPTCLSFSIPRPARPLSIIYAGKIGSCHAPEVRATLLAPGARPACHATAVKSRTASAPSMERLQPQESPQRACQPCVPALSLPKTPGRSPTSRPRCAMTATWKGATRRRGVSGATPTGPLCPGAPCHPAPGRTPSSTPLPHWRGTMQPLLR
jgi:hypothetical protein